jgi:hypothetical protein
MVANEESQSTILGASLKAAQAELLYLIVWRTI